MSQSFADIPRPQSSPWGPVQDATHVAPGIWFVSTEGHGGYLLSTERRLAMPEHLKQVYTFAGGNWYEEDCDWSLVALAFPDTFPADALPHARATVLAFDHEPRDDFERRSTYYRSMRVAAVGVKAAA